VVAVLFADPVFCHLQSTERYESGVSIL
jgi:hypothetical protein